MGELQRLLHDPVFHRLGLTLVHFLWQGLALALLALLLRGLLRRATPARRYLVFLGLFVTMAAAPVLTFTLWTKAPPPTVMTMVEIQRLLATAARQRPAPILSRGSEVQTPARPSRSSLLAGAGEGLRALWWRVRRRLPVAGLLWMAGVLALSFRLLLQWGLFVRVVRRAKPLAEEHWQRLLASLYARLGVRRAVRLLQSVEVGMPAAAGWLRPVILLPPAALLGLTPAQLEAVIAHELAHTRRHDFLVNVFQRVVEVLLFYHPAVWWFSGLIRVERELCCDDLVVAVCGDRVTYARALEELESRRGSAPPPTLSVARGPVLERVRRLLLPVEEGRRPLSWSTVLLPTLALTVIALISSIAPVGGKPYVPGTLVCGKSATQGRVFYWEHGGDAASVISGRSQWTVEEAAPLHLLEYSPRGNEVLFYQSNGLYGTDVPPEQNASDIWKAPVDWLGRPDFSRAVNLIERAGIEPGDTGRGRWSLDGRRILFLRLPAHVPEDYCHYMQLWVMNDDGTGAHEVHLEEGRTVNGGGIQWAPNGSQLLVSARDRKRPDALGCDTASCRTYLVDLRGGLLHTFQLQYAAMSPDGGWIAGVWMDPPRGVVAAATPQPWRKPSAGVYQWQLLLLRPDGTEQRVLRSASYPQADLPADPRPTALALMPRDLVWSPDGQQLAFVAALDWDPKGPPINRQVELCIYDLPSDRLIQVTDDDLEQCTPVWME